MLPARRLGALAARALCRAQSLSPAGPAAHAGSRPAIDTTAVIIRARGLLGLQPAGARTGRAENRPASRQAATAESEDAAESAESASPAAAVAAAGSSPAPKNKGDSAFMRYVEKGKTKQKQKQNKKKYNVDVVNLKRCGWPVLLFGFFFFFFVIHFANKNKKKTKK
jgi:hypothetical protein